MTTVLLRTLRRGRVFVYDGERYRVIDRSPCGVAVLRIEPKLVKIGTRTFRARHDREQVWALNSPVQVTGKVGALEVA